MQPTLITPRLMLRSFVPDDAPAIQRLAGDFEVARTTGTLPHPYPPDAAAAFIAAQAEAAAAGKAACFAVTRQSDGALLGSMGLTLNSAHRSAELGYWIGKLFWGQGIATEAAAAVIEFGFVQLRLQRIWAGHFACNPASGRVLEKVGMTREGVLREHFVRWDVPQDCVRWGILAREWQKLKEERAPAVSPSLEP